MKKFLIAVLMLLVLGCSTDYVVPYDVQLTRDLKVIDKYLDDNGLVAIEDVSGLRVVLEDAGTGLFPDLNSVLTVKYTGKFLNNGTVFTQNNENSTGGPLPLKDSQGNPMPLKNLIQAWIIGFTTYVGKDGKATFYVPSGLGYGAAGTNGIPANANLIFEVELIGFTN